MKLNNTQIAILMIISLSFLLFVIFMAIHLLFTFPEKTTNERLKSRVLKVSENFLYEQAAKRRQANIELEQVLQSDKEVFKKETSKYEVIDISEVGIYDYSPPEGYIVENVLLSGSKMVIFLGLEKK